MLAAGQQKPANPPAPGKTHTGTVTKLLDNFGFIDDSIFFPLSAIKGVNVKLGDKVYYECTYSKNLPFNWNATLVQLAPPNAPLGQSAAGGPSGGGYEHKPPQQGQQPQQPPPQQYPMHQQQQQPPQHQSGNYSMPPYQASSGPNSSSSSSYYHPQSKPMPYQQQQQPYQSSYGNSNSGPHNQAPPQQQPPPAQPAAGQQSHQAPYPDMSQVQKAVAAAAQLSQYYTPPGAGPPGQAPGPNNAHAGPPGANQQHQGPGGGPNGGPPHGQPPAGAYGQIQYTSTPGSAFINAPQQYQPGPPKPPGPQGPPPNRGPPHPQGPGGPMGGPPGGRWGDPVREERFDPRRPGGPMGGGGPPPVGPPGSRFDGPPGRGPKSRFNDSDRFGGPSIPIPPPPPPPQQQQHQPMNNDTNSRFGPSPQQQQKEVYRPQGGAPPGRDEFGRDIPKNDSRFGPRDGPINRGIAGDKEPFRAVSRDKDAESVTTNESNDKDRGRGGRDRRRGNRGGNRGHDKKRSISPVSVASSSGGTTRGDSTRTVPTGPSKRRYESTNIPKNLILRNRYSAIDLKSKISSAVHVPSDLKEVLYNVDADLDLLDIPKPLVYKITNIEKEKEKDSKSKEAKDKKADTPSKSSQKAVDKPKEKEKEKEKEKDKEKEKMKDKDKDKDKESTAEPKPTESESKTTTEGDKSEIKSEQSATEEKKDVPDSNSSQALTEASTQESSGSVKEEPEESTMPVDSQTTIVSTQRVEVSTGSSAEHQEETEPKDMEIDDDSNNAENSTSVIETNVPLDAVREKPSEVNVTEPSGTQHKFNVKVLLISLPTMAEINEKIFGPDFDSTNFTSSKNRVTHFNKLFSALVFRNTDSGYSLVGGKWVPEKDGTLPGKEDSPNLIATAIRVVHEQTGLNLTSCRQWKVFSTFIYNRDTSLDRKNSSYEITKIYMPDIWSALDTIYVPLGGAKEESVQSDESKPIESKHAAVEPAKQPQTEITEAVANNSQPNDEQMEEDSSSTAPATATTTASQETDIISQEMIEEPEDKPDREYLESVLENLNDMKVADLRSELEKLNQKVEGRPRKDQLATRLRDYVNEQLALLKETGTAVNEKPEEKTAVTNKEVEVALETTELEPQQNGLQEGKSTESESDGVKRKLNDSAEMSTDELQEDSPSKKQKTQEEPAAPEKIPQEVSISATGSDIKVKGHHLSVVSLSALLNPHKFDQFELCVVAELIRDSLVIHFARYILSSIIHNYQSLKSASTNSPSVSDKHRVLEVNYVHLAFSYFDKGHCGHMLADDLNNLLNATGFALSRKVYNGVTSACGGDRIVYRDFVLPTSLIDHQIDYPSVSAPATGTLVATASTVSDGRDGPLIVERNGIQFNVDELIRQSEADQKLKVRLNEELIGSNSKVGQLEQTITELETKQKKMSAATGRQNDELCAVKRERDQLKAKYEALRKTLEKTVSTLNETIKQYQPVSAAPLVPINATDGLSSQATESS